MGISSNDLKACMSCDWTINGTLIVPITEGGKSVKVILTSFTL